MIEEFIQMLSKINSLKHAQRLGEAAETIDEEFARLLGVGAAAAAQLSDTELLARLIKGESTQAVSEKTLLIATLFKEAGDVATTQNLLEAGGSYYLKSLNLLLDLLAREETFHCPDFVPRVENLVLLLQGKALPLAIEGRLMQHYERIGEFAKAEDCLFTMLETHSERPGLVEFGTDFYERLRSHSDAALEAGNLPRTELLAGLSELRNMNGAGSTNRQTVGS
jgi:hypothetical protein